VAKFSGAVSMPAGFTVPAGQVWDFDPNVSTTVTVAANVIVYGTLRMRPASPGVVHKLAFTGINEAGVVGGGTAPLASDVGLWVDQAGVLDMAGSVKKAWTVAMGALAAGATSFSVASATGWRVGDQIVITPTKPPKIDDGAFKQDNAHAKAYDEVAITAINGNTVTTAPLTFDHPAPTFTDLDGVARSHPAEVLNITRNVVIEGTSTGRTHITLFKVGPQNISNVEIRFVGPRPGDPANPPKTVGALGRYGLHFHHSDDGTVGTVIDCVVVHHSGSHAFVPHESNGITFRNCVAHDCNDTAFWWDLEDTAGVAQATSGTTWDACVASKVYPAASSLSPETYRLAGFQFGDGTDLSNRLTGCVSVGVRLATSIFGVATDSGFHWPEKGHAVWVFHNNLAHNCGGSGLFTWQNDALPHLIEDFAAFHNGQYGMEHGAYANLYTYRRLNLHGNRRGMGIHATTRRVNSVTSGFLTIEDVCIDGANITTRGIESPDHRNASNDDGPTNIIRPRVTRCRDRSWYEPVVDHRGYYEITDAVLEQPLWIEDPTAAGDPSILVFHNLNGDGAIITVRPKGQPGTFRPDWNASVSAGNAPLSDLDGVEVGHKLGEGGEVTIHEGPDSGDGLVRPRQSLADG
jgi:hypothetical protein